MTLAAVVTSAAFRKFSYLPRRMPQIAEVRDAVLSGEICILMWPQAPSAVSMTMVAVVGLSASSRMWPRWATDHGCESSERERARERV